MANDVLEGSVPVLYHTKQSKAATSLLLKQKASPGSHLSRRLSIIMSTLRNQSSLLDVEDLTLLPPRCRRERCSSVLKPQGMKLNWKVPEGVTTAVFSWLALLTSTWQGQVAKKYVSLSAESLVNEGYVWPKNQWLFSKLNSPQMGHPSPVWMTCLTSCWGLSLL